MRALVKFISYSRACECGLEIDTMTVGANLGAKLSHLINEVLAVSNRERFACIIKKRRS